MGHQISFPPDLWSEFSKAAARLKVPRAKIIQGLIREWLDRLKAEDAVKTVPLLQAQVDSLQAEVERLREKVEGDA